MKHALSVQQIFKMQGLSQLEFIQFLEDNLFIMWKHPWANILISTIFYAMLILESYLCLVRSDSAYRVDRFNGFDAIFYLTTFTLENPAKSEISIAFTISTMFCICYLLIICLTLLLKVTDFPFLRSCFSFLCFYTAPCTLVSICNCLMLNYGTGDALIVGSKSIIFIMHCFFIALVIFLMLTSFGCPIHLNHPFMIVRPFQCTFVFSYFLIFIHLGLSKEKWTLYLRIIFAFFIFFYCLIYPPYLHKFLNYLIYAFEINEIVVVFLVFLIKNRDRKLDFALYCLPVVIFAPLLIIFVVNPIIFKISGFPKEIAAFYLKSDEKCRKLIEQMNITKLSSVNNRILIIISLHLKCNNMSDLVIQYHHNLRMIHEVCFVWVAYSRLNSHRDQVSHRLLRHVETFEQNIVKYNEYFWSNVLDSNILVLPELAGHIGRDRYRLLKYSSFLSRKFPTITFSNEVEKHCQQSSCEKIVSILGWFDFLIFIAFSAFLVGHSLIFASGKQACSFIDDFFVFQDFTSKINIVYSNIWNIDQHDSILANWELTNIAFEKLKTIPFVLQYDKMIELANGFVTFRPKLEEFIKKLLLTHSFELSAAVYPFEAANHFFNLLGFALNRSSSIFTDKTANSMTLYRTYILVICIFFPILFVSVITVFLVRTRNRAVDAFESFRTVDKKVVKQLCHKPTKIAHRKSFHILKSIPGTIAYVTFVMLAVIFFVLLMLLNQWNDDTNHEEIRLVTRSFSSLQVVLLWMVQGVTHFTFREYNSTSKILYAEMFSNCDLSMDFLLRNESLSHFTCLVPLTILDYVGQLLINEHMQGFQNWYNVLRTANDNINNKTAEYSYLQHFFVARFLAFFVCAFISYAWIVYFMIEISPFSTAEQSEYSRKSKEAGIVFSFKHHKVRMADIPLKFIVINTGKKVMFSSLKAKKKIAVGTKLTTKGLVDVEIDKFLSEIRHEHIEIKTKKSTFYIVPFYDFSQKDVRFDRALVVIRDEKKATVTEEILNKLFYKLYPEYVPIDTQFPAVIPSVNKTYILLLVKIDGFDDWASKTAANASTNINLTTNSNTGINININTNCSPNDCANYRTKLSGIVSDVCREGEVFCRIRESSETIVLAMRHEEKTPMILWRALDATSDFAQKLIRQLKILNADFGVEFAVTVTLYKTIEPPLHLGCMPMQLSDFKSDAIFRAEEFAQKSIPFSINYTSSQKERMMVPNTSKIKTCRTANGEQYDILLVV